LETVLFIDFNLDNVSPNVATKHFHHITNPFKLKQLIINPTMNTHHSRILIYLFFTTKVVVGGVFENVVNRKQMTHFFKFGTKLSHQPINKG